MIVTRADLLRALRAIGVEEGMALEVHCAMGQIGHVEGGPETVIDALMQVVGQGGALVMPSFRLSPEQPLDAMDVLQGITSKIRILPENAPRTAMGQVADSFRARPDVITGEGIFQVSAWGRDAAAHAASGFGKIIAERGMALLIGVDIYRLSSMHYVEDALPAALSARFAPPEAVWSRYDKTEWMIEA